MLLSTVQLPPTVHEACAKHVAVKLAVIHSTVGIIIPQASAQRVGTGPPRSFSPRAPAS